MERMIRDIVAEFPQNPGVYIMKNHDDLVIYVGKAKNLKKRVSSYFTGEKDIKTRLLRAKIHHIDYIITQNEYEALVLENNLIKEHSPRYNIRLKDGKSYPVIRITNEKFPRVFRTRRIVQDGSKYFGPFPDTRKLDSYLDLIEKLFPLRKCRGPLKKRDRPCLYYHIGRCKAPCIGNVTEEEYKADVDRVQKLIKGNTKSLLKDLQKEMQEASEQLLFEKAAEFRDAIQSVMLVQQETQVQDFDYDYRDYIVCEQRDELASIGVMKVRNGKLIAQDFYHTEIYNEISEHLEQFILQFYSKDNKPPERVFIDGLVDIDLLNNYFDQQGYKDSKVLVPRLRKDKAVLNMAIENTKLDLAKRIQAKGNREALKLLKSTLKLSKTPRVIEGFDIAHLHGTNPVASMVHFKNGKPEKSAYRHFHMKTLDGGIDDFASMREVVARRYTKLLNTGAEIPDLIVIDGGRGQLNAAREIIDMLELDIEIVSLAKKEEEVYTLGRKEPYRLPRNHEGLKILQWVRDESHRFATGFQKNLRKKDATISILENVPGIGPKRSARLLQEFGSLEAVINADPEGISKILKIPLDLSRQIQLFLSESK
jgi:excinuclease ABC subunit C